MSTNFVIDLLDKIQAPDIPGLLFRGFQGETDFPGMVAVRDACRESDGLERVWTVEDYERRFRYLVNCDPAKDKLMVEMDGELIGSTRVWWEEESDGRIICYNFAQLVPQWRGRGIWPSMLQWNEERLHQISVQFPLEKTKVLRVWVGAKEEQLAELLTNTGYAPARYFFEMVRPNLENIPDLAIPDGLTVRPPVNRDEYWKVFKAEEEIFQDHWGATDWKEEWFEEWQEEPTFNPSLYQVAWDGDEVAGMVLNFIDNRENEDHNRKRGYTEDIGVRRAYRRRGLAKALIARSLRVLKEQGIEEAALGVDVENPSGALGLYEDMGYVTIKRDMVMEKALQQAEA
ncbi:MAG: GNAT family N-acetyltransferase [Anaerolineales bacterium]|nr:GNAT family N-acetyltransferase [Anaerolineales bacterium]